MVLKSDDHTGELFRVTDSSEDFGSTVAASEGRGQQGPGQGKYKSSIIRSANGAKEFSCSGANKDDRNRSCNSGIRNNLGPGAEVVDSRTSSGSLGLVYGMEDMHHESVKHIQLSEGTAKLSASSRYKTHDQTEKNMGSNDVSESDEKGTFLGDGEPDDEENVKVCDTCGDAGRVDLLAFCSRCSDGAEHTYCMRELLVKAPQRDWLCEECKYNEALEARRQDHLKLRATKRSKSLRRIASISSDISSKLDSKDSFSECGLSRTVSLSKHISLKRSGDNTEAGPTATKLVIESNTGSPTAASLSQVPVLSKDCSLKDSDKAKGMETNQFSAGTDSGGESSENALSPTTNSKDILVKSNSFCSKANIKGSEEVQTQKLVVDVKDGPKKLAGKSVSLKGLGCSSVGLVSPKCSPIQELKGQKQIRDHTSLEIKNSIKLDNSFSVHTTVNSTERLPRGDYISTSSLTSCNYKNAQSDGKLTSSREVKRLSSTNMRGSGASSFAEAKSSHVSSKNRSTFSSSRAFDGSYGRANETKVDAHDSQTENAPENASSYSRPGAHGALAGGNRRGFSLDSSTLKTKDGAHEENKLKAAIEAAMQKKRDIYKKNKLPVTLSEFSMSNSQANLVENAVSNQAADLLSEKFVLARDTGLSDHTSNSCKQISISIAKQFKSVDFESSGDYQFTMSPIPEPEAIWQGRFEIHRNGKLSDICGGFQAHLSSSASNKVLEVVRKLPQKIVFKEVSRPSVWPFQFKEASVREDNIALYFFAKDQESYLRSCKLLLEYMMKHDLALSGNINGFELLMFPSNHLDDRLQRWNTLFFMWGIFRGRRARHTADRCPLERPELAVSDFNKLPRIKDNSSAACLSKNTSLRRPAVEDSSLSGSDTVVSRCEASVLDGPSLQKPGPLVDGDCYNEGCSVEAHSESSIAALENRSQLGIIVVQHLCSYGDNGNDLHNESKKTRSNDILDKVDISSHSSKWTKLPMVVKQEDFSVSSDDTESNDVEEKSDKNLNQEDRCVDGMKKDEHQLILNNVDQMVEYKDSTWKYDRVEVKGKNRLKQIGYVEISVHAGSSMEELHKLQCYIRKKATDGSEATTVVTSEKRQRMDQKNLLGGDDQPSIKKRIKGKDSFYGRRILRVSSSFHDGLDTEMNDVSSSSFIDYRSNEALIENLKYLNGGSTERCFFLVDSHAAESAQSENRSSRWKLSMLGNENRQPELELALGVENKQLKKRGVLPFFAGVVDINPDRPPDIASPEEENEDAGASLSLPLSFPFTDR